MSKDQWLQKFYVPRAKGGVYTVSLAKDMVSWGCSCKDWIFRRKQLFNGECQHIKLVKETGGMEFRKPSYITSRKATKPKFDSGANELVVPPRTTDERVEMTVAFYMLSYGFTIRETRSIRELPDNWNAQYITDQMLRYGEAEYKEMCEAIMKERTRMLEPDVRRLLI